ncbi:MAG: hypothetical protein WBZ42_04785 [Halobacteriota archaeon]
MNEKDTLFVRSEGTPDTSGDFYREMLTRSDAELWELLIFASAAIKHIRGRAGGYAAWSAEDGWEEWYASLATFEEYSLDALLYIYDEFFKSIAEASVLGLLSDKRGAEYELQRRGCLQAGHVRLRDDVVRISFSSDELRPAEDLYDFVGGKKGVSDDEN